MKRTLPMLAIGTIALAACGSGASTKTAASNKAPVTTFATTTTTAAPTTTTTEAPTTSTAPPMVVYNVMGGHVDITYADPSDGTIQQVTVNGPWSKSWPVGGLSSSFYSVSVQNAIDSSGVDSCTITVAGTVASTHSASGFNIADCKNA
jgi:hypothetical protein